MLYVAAKIVVHSNADQLRYSMHEQRAAGLMDFLQYLDRRRAKEVSGRAKKILQQASRRSATQSPLSCYRPPKLATSVQNSGSTFFGPVSLLMRLLEAG